MDNKQIQTKLNNNGFPCGAVDGNIGPATKDAVTKFQRACNSGVPLTIDGVPGPLTQVAIGALPQLSANFTVGELQCHHCGKCYVRRELLQGLEKLRSALNLPIHVIDAYRCPIHNKEVGGVSGSEHVDGTAADIPGICGWRKVASLEIFSGIGDRNGAISHVDMRHLDGGPFTPEKPARWTY